MITLHTFVGGKMIEKKENKKGGNPNCTIRYQLRLVRKGL